MTFLGGTLMLIASVLFLMAYIFAAQTGWMTSWWPSAAAVYGLTAALAVVALCLSAVVLTGRFWAALALAVTALGFAFVEVFRLVLWSSPVGEALLPVVYVGAAAGLVLTPSARDWYRAKQDQRARRVRI